jgi:hypothetical protein
MDDIAIAEDAYRATLREAVIAQNMAAYGRSRVPSPRLCREAWEPSIGDIVPTTCQLPRGHRARHYHLPKGATLAALEWD